MENPAQVRCAFRMWPIILPFQHWTEFPDSQRRRRPHPHGNPAFPHQDLSKTQIPGSGALVWNWNLPMLSPALVAGGTGGPHTGSAICEGV